MSTPNPLVLFFGSTPDSLLVLDTIGQHVVAVVTQPPAPMGRKQVMTPSPVEVWANEHKITVLTFVHQKEKPWLYQNEQTVIDTLDSVKYDLVISASYGQKIPPNIISKAKYGGLNVHPSVLPRFRGTDPTPWTILAGDAQCGVTIVTLSEKFDQGKIIAQQKIPTPPDALPNNLKPILFALGAKLLIATLPDYLSGANPGASQDPAHAKYARRLTRQDGFIPWETIERAQQGIKVPTDLWPPLFQSVASEKSLQAHDLPLVITRATRALAPWPGVWTQIETRDKGQGTKNKMRLKILEVSLSPVSGGLSLDIVQLEGKQPVPYEQFAQAYLSPKS